MAERVGALSVSTLTVICVLLCSSAPAEAGGIDGDTLQVGHYDKTCPQAEDIVREAVDKAITVNRGLAASLIRLHFHDCFVNGCDASILLDKTPSGEPVEMTSPGNKGVRGMEIIDDAKARLEKECPDTVSCADIVAFAARDAAVASGISHYKVPGGRRDGLVSRAIDTKENLPRPSSNVSVMAKVFIEKGLSLQDLVTLSGAHSIGASHCSAFNYRLYNFSTAQPLDPELDALYAFTLKLICPKVDNRDAMVRFDPVTPTKLDNVYYLEIMAGRGLLTSDQVLASDPQTSAMVMDMAMNPDLWNQNFGEAMIRLGRIGVLTGKEGEIRRSCRVVNNK